MDQPDQHVRNTLSYGYSHGLHALARTLYKSSGEREKRSPMINLPRLRIV
jgi:hypothetical protein